MLLLKLMQLRGRGGEQEGRGRVEAEATEEEEEEQGAGGRGWPHGLVIFIGRFARLVETRACFFVANVGGVVQAPVRHLECCT